MEFFDTIRDKVISFRKGVRNLCYFFNVIWNYRDFDYSYMLGVEERIMESMKKYFEDVILLKVILRLQETWDCVSRFSKKWRIVPIIGTLRRERDIHR